MSEKHAQLALFGDDPAPSTPVPEPEPWPGFVPEPRKPFCTGLVREIMAAGPKTAKEIYRDALCDNIPMVQTRLVQEVPFRVDDRCQVRNPADAARLLFDYYADRDREEFLVLMLDARGTVTAIHVASVGGLAASIVEPRQVFKTAVLCNAAAIVLPHNHPSGSLDPSCEDKAVTKQLVEAGKIMGIRVHDHLIIGGRGFTSLAEQGLL
jgi:DNA repair protein RadC